MPMSETLPKFPKAVTLEIVIQPNYPGCGFFPESGF